MANYKEIREETIRIELNKEFFSYEIPSIEFATGYIQKGLETLVRTYDGLVMENLTISNLIADVRRVFISSGITYFLKRDVLVLILFEGGGNVKIYADISED